MQVRRHPEHWLALSSWRSRPPLQSRCSVRTVATAIALRPIVEDVHTSAVLPRGRELRVQLWVQDHPPRDVQRLQVVRDLARAVSLPAPMALGTVPPVAHTMSRSVPCRPEMVQSAAEKRTACCTSCRP
eukprot:scaffold2321_cov245-Pinguiococcus_pyrenoidosus.AAC.2